jgi:hypothetical protein
MEADEANMEDYEKHTEKEDDERIWKRKVQIWRT